MDTDKHEKFKNVKLKRASGLAMVMDTPKGRGIIATEGIPARTIIETSPVLVIPLNDVNGLKSTTLSHYTYNWPIKPDEKNVVSKAQAVALGLGSLFNHSNLAQNVGWQRDVNAQYIRYTALRDIAAGEELCINYGRLWFPDADQERIMESEESENDLLNCVEVFEEV